MVSSLRSTVRTFSFTIETALTTNTLFRRTTLSLLIDIFSTTESVACVNTHTADTSQIPFSVSTPEEGDGNPTVLTLTSILVPSLCPMISYAWEIQTRLSPTAIPFTIWSLYIPKLSCTYNLGVHI